LLMQFPRFFYISNHQQASIRDMRVIIDSIWRFNFSWRSNYFFWEDELLDALLEVLSRVLLFASRGFVGLETRGEWTVLGQFNV